MARAHAAAALHMGLSPLAVCRSNASAERFAAATGVSCQAVDLDTYLAGVTRPSAAIVAVTIDALLDCSVTLLERGVRKILVEKPAAVEVSQIIRLAEVATAMGADVYVAYNRRFYNSVTTARSMISDDGGATSAKFDFTERADLIGALPHSTIVKNNWLLANSSHVIDLAFFLAGAPSALDARTVGALPWHPAGARFVGSGITEDGALFSYHADWEAPGRWSVDVRTRRRRLILEPLEELRVQTAGAFTVAPVEISAEPAGLKPGILGQLRAFLGQGDTASLVTIQAHAQRATSVYEAICARTNTAEQNCNPPQ